MVCEWGSNAPVLAGNYPGSETLRQQYRQCRCGTATFLPLPCRVCGGTTWEPAFDRALRKAKKQRARRWLLSVPYMLGMSVLGFLIWPPLAVAAITAPLAALIFELVQKSDARDTCFWLFHRDAKGSGELPIADVLALDEMITAYDTDLGRLEKILAENPSQDNAVQVYHMAQGMAALYHNRRVSALLLRCLLVLPVREGIYIDVDQVCAWLEPEDLPSSGALRKLADCARFTCLRLGEPTARFAARVSAARVQDALMAQQPDLSVAEACDRTSLEQVFSPEERKALGMLWITSSVGSLSHDVPQETLRQKKDGILINNLPEGSRAVADFWFRNLWYNAESIQRQEMDRLAGQQDKMSRILLETWGGTERTVQT